MPSWLPLLLLAALLVLAPWLWPGRLALSLLAQFTIALVGCLSYNLLLGQGGMLSFGHAVFGACGAYAVVHALLAAPAWLPPALLGGAAAALPVALLPLVGGVAGALVAALFGLVATRSAGTAFAMITLALGELAAAAALLLPALFGGEGGLAVDRSLHGAPGSAAIDLGVPLQLYALLVVYALGCVALLGAFVRTPPGRMLNAVRDCAERAAAVGYDPRRVRWLAFTVAGFFAGIGGGMHALQFELASPELFGAARSGAWLLFTVLGGSAAFVAGPAIGAALMVATGALLSSWTQAALLYLGLAFIAVVLFAPDGIAGASQRALQALAAAPRRRRRWALLGALALAPLLGGLVAGVEMAYRLPLRDTWGTRLTLLGLPFDATTPASWSLALLLLLLGAALLTLARRGWRRGING